MTGPLLLATAILAPMVVVSAVNLVAAPRLHRVAPRSGPRVSVLVPARNEAANLRRLLPALLASDYADLEVLVLDDGSVDETGAVARGFAASDRRVRPLDGSEPPPGWSGKNWACHQLAEAATGERLVFCDADVVPGPNAVARTATALDDARLDVVTALPRHVPGGWFQEAVIPLVATVPIVALLPLPLVRWTRAVSLSAGNGQWFAWRRDAYHRLGGHARVQADVLEDVRLGRLAKAAGLRLGVYVASRDLAVRMYRDGAATREGFVKNLYPLVGGRPWRLAAALAAALIAGLLPLLLPRPDMALSLVPLAELAAIRVMAAALVQDRLATVVLHPVGLLAVAALAVESWRRHHRGIVEWKGRILAHEEAT